MNTALPINQTGDSTRPLFQRFRSRVISWTASLLNSTQHIQTKSVEIRWPDHLRWWLEGQIERLFYWAYAGSDEELQAVYQSEIPLKYMNERQRNVLTLPRSEFVAYCAHCRWQGWLVACPNDECPQCQHPVYLHELNFQN